MSYLNFAKNIITNGLQKIGYSLYEEVYAWQNIGAIVVAVGCGIVYAFHHQSSIDLYHLKYLIVFLLLLLLILFLAQKAKPILRNEFIIDKIGISFVILQVVAAFYFGEFLITRQINELQKYPELKKKYIFIKVVGDVEKIEEFENRYRILISNVDIPKFRKKDKIPYRLRLNVSRKHLPRDGDNDDNNNISSNVGIKIGDKISTFATIYPPSPPILKGGYNFKEIAFFKKIGGVGYSNKQLKIRERRKLGKFFFHVERTRQGIKERFHRLMDKYNKDSAGIATALVTGDKSGISTDIRQAYVDSGIAHILAISGLHMALIAALFFFMIRGVLCFFPRVVLDFNTKKIAAFLTIIVITFYLLLCYEAVSAQRSYIMTTMVLVAVIVGRYALTIRNVMLAALIIMLIDPYAIMGISFLLSFAAVSALVAFYNSSYAKFMKTEKDKDDGFLKSYVKKIITIIMGLVVTSLIATVATAPFSLYFFKQLTVSGIITNIIAIPFVSFIIMPLLLLATILLLFFHSGGSFLTDLIYSSLSYAIELLTNIAFKFSEYKSLVIYVQEPSYDAIVITIAGFLLSLLCVSSLFKRLGVVSFVVGLFMLLRSNGPDYYYYVSSSGAKYQGFHDKENNILYIASNRKNKFITKVWQQNAGMPEVKQVKKLPVNYSDTLLCDNG